MIAEFYEMVYINVIFLYLKNFYGSKLMVAIFNYSICNQLLLNILRVISQKYGHNL